MSRTFCVALWNSIQDNVEKSVRLSVLPPIKTATLVIKSLESFSWPSSVGQDNCKLPLTLAMAAESVLSSK